MMILTIVCLKWPRGAGRVGHHHPVRAGIVRPPPGPHIDEGIGGSVIVTAVSRDKISCILGSLEIPILSLAVMVSYELTCDPARVKTNPGNLT